MQSQNLLSGILGLLVWSSAHSESAIEYSRYAGLTVSGAPAPVSTPPDLWACVTDLETGLTWESRTHDYGPHDFRQTYTWRNTPATGSVAQCELPDCNADAYIARLNSERWCGFENWRLPDREELRSIVDYRREIAGSTVFSAMFPNTAAQFYWGAETDVSDPLAAWGIGFVFGFDYAYPKNSVGHIRLVRGREAERNETFERFADGTVLDRRTGLVWNECLVGQTFEAGQCRGVPKELTQDEALAPGIFGPDWRLPELAELTSLTDLSRSRSAIRPDVFPGTPPADFWTSTPFARRPTQNWVVNFTFGEGAVSSERQHALVRTVRNAPRQAPFGISRFDLP